MGVIKTPNFYKALTFDGASSRNYGVFITGEAVFNAPERDVEMISIPGRNGAFALDKGHFNNIEVTYPAGIFAENETDFAEAVSNFRNYLCSRSGYCRLTDEYNPDEYRLAVYKSGLDVTPANLIAGEFDITFECKPQRYLTAGETALTVASGGKITNPTLFESKPQLQVWGYGEIELGGSGTVTVANGEIGTTQIASAEPMDEINGTKTQSLDVSALNNGDDIIVGNVSFNILDARIGPGKHFQAISLTSVTNGTAVTSLNGSMNGNVDVTTDYITFTNGTAGSLVVTVDYSETIEGTVYTFTGTLTVDYDGNDTITYSATVTPNLPIGTVRAVYVTPPDIFGISTKSALGAPLYIDLDIGEAYSIINGSAVSVNNSVSIPAELPTLAPGETTITFDNTVTQLKVVPRWWKV